MLRNVLSLPEDSKVWIYQSPRPFTYDEIDEIRQTLYDFADGWQSHGMVVPAHANVFHRQFIVFIADESKHGISGCSKDSAVRVVKDLEQKYNIDLFDRWLFCYFDDERLVHALSKEDFRQAYHNQQINDETLVFDPLVSNKEEFLLYWLKPLQSSWHSKFIT